MSKLKTRVGKLENQTGNGVVIFIVAGFGGDEEPEIQEAWVDGSVLCPRDGESHQDFRRRANPRGMPSADLETSVKDL